MKHLDVYKKMKFNISYERRMQSLTQQQLSEKAGISRAYMSRIEAPNNAIVPSLDVLIDIANALDIKLAKLFDFKD